MTITPSATTLVNGSAVTGAVAVAASSSVTLALASTLGVRSVTYTIVGNHDSGATNPTITTAADFTASFTMPAGSGQGYLIETKVNGGIDSNGRVVAGYKFRFIVGVVGSSGVVPAVLGEKDERGSYGWQPLINTALDGATNPTFTNDTASGGNPTLRVAPDTAAEFAQLADAGSVTYDYDPGVDGYYSLVYEFRLITGGGSYRKVAVNQDFKRVSGICSLEGSTVTLGTGVQTGVAVAFSIASDDVRVTVTNTTGSTLDGHYWRTVLSGDLPS